MRVVAALGGNALLRRDQPPTAQAQRENAAAAAKALAPLLEDNELVLTHGNGPQVGLLALQAMAYAAVPTYPLDVLDAESEGMIGYVLEQELRGRAPGREVVTVLTHIAVDPQDPAFCTPTKPVGPLYAAAEVQQLREAHGWNFLPDGDRFRRAVPSPEPLTILQLPAIRLLLESGFVVICAGGGGIPVTTDPNEHVRGVEAVIDKDLASALLARSIGADVLLLLTDVPAVMSGWQTPCERPILSATPGEIRQLALPAGSMAPKAEAAARFVEAGGRFAAIGRLEQAGDLLREQAGTVIRG